MADAPDTRSRRRQLARGRDPTSPREQREPADGPLEALARGQKAAQELRQHHAATSSPEQPRVELSEAIEALQASQALVQEARVFEQRLRQDERLFALKLVMAWTSYVVLLMATIYVLKYHRDFDTTFTQVAVATTWTQTVCLCLWLWRGVSRRGQAELRPITTLPASRADAER